MYEHDLIPYRITSVIGNCLGSCKVCIETCRTCDWLRTDSHISNWNLGDTTYFRFLINPRESRARAAIIFKIAALFDVQTLGWIKTKLFTDGSDLIGNQDACTPNLANN